MTCDEITDNHILMKKCNHGFAICYECFDNLKKNNGKYKCPYCNCYTNITKLYFVN